MQNVSDEQQEGQFIGQLLTADTEDDIIEMMKGLSHRQAVDLETVICGDPLFWPNEPEPETHDAERAARRTAKHIIDHRVTDPEEALDALGDTVDPDGSESP